eukprot:scaffold206_cov54-Attheya_sp.AAC.5
MAGKAARERRRLQRLDEAVTEAPPAKTNGGGGSQSQTTSTYSKNKKNDPTGSINHHNRYSTKQYPSHPQQQQQQQQRDTRYQSGPFKSKSQPNGTTGGAATTRTTNMTTTPNKKFKKPKHLKRKLAQLDSVPETSEEDQELRSRLLRQAKVLEEVKQKRSLKFQARLKELAGDKFDNDTFQHLTQTGASTKTILEAVGVTDTATGTTTSTSTSTTTTPSVVPVAQTQETSPPNNESASLKSKSKSKHVANTGTHDMKRSTPKSPTTNDAKEKHLATPSAAAAADTDTTPDDSDASSSCPSSSGSDDDDDDSSDSEDEAVPEETRRTRGRGKKRIREVPEHSTDSNDVDSPSSPSKSHVKANESVVVDVVDKKETTTKDEATENVKKPKKVPDPSKKTPKKDDKRRCIGRKPVTEFEVGKRYNGTVIYVKSFGAFVDIGSHSDAFVHISHVQDEFVKVDSISNLLEVGATVSARVVEIDRTKKRITASLQSDEKLDAAEERKKQKMQAQMQTTPSHFKPSGAKKFDSDNSSSKIPMMEPPKTEPTLEVQKNEVDMTPAELKRARKLARRADRREQKETTGISA